MNESSGGGLGMLVVYNEEVWSLTVEAKNRGVGGSSEGTGWSDMPDCSQERRELPRMAVNT